MIVQKRERKSWWSEKEREECVAIVRWWIVDASCQKRRWNAAQVLTSVKLTVRIELKERWSWKRSNVREWRLRMDVQLELESPVRGAQQIESRPLALGTCCVGYGSEMWMNRVCQIDRSSDIEAKSKYKAKKGDMTNRTIEKDEDAKDDFVTIVGRMDDKKKRRKAKTKNERKQNQMKSEWREAKKSEKEKRRWEGRPGCGCWWLGGSADEIGEWIDGSKHRIAYTVVRLALAADSCSKAADESKW